MSIPAQVPDFTLKYQRLWLGIGLGWIALVIYLSLTSRPPLPDIEITHIDKLGHFIAYAWLMLWFANLFRETCQRAIWLMVFIVLGLSMEALQLQTGARQFEWADFIANTSGAVLAFMLTAGKLKYLLYHLENRFKP